ncbi:exodeoxyribonuclease VII large subunit [Lacticaseibacillus yichunensis]|uniref:Exodeoxyribonuclease 7 large subunit n=1 Tax=Lacticaseibacillus yichunensis TaxID=2486015 RepID=A0ABW4CPB7_9LACO|nr:exodeoxyribonuclease VII large subunit [Lacticaseibacillus yichunensis]
MVAQSEYLTVSLLTRYIKRKYDLDPYLAKVYLSGEISNFRQRPGHQYFSLKDDNAKINAVMFAGNFAKLKFRPEEGMKVLVVGRITLYERSGEYQIVIEKMEPDGVGALYAALEQLKQKLSAEGLFDRNQRPLPLFPKRVAVITSPSGAVIQDIMTTVARRYPILQLTLFPAQVQGEQAAPSLVKQLAKVKAMGGFDALIIGRGGGSIEDLWPFNEESVARALIDMPMPIVSSVGHETDTTITDFIADHRAATPTAAAELVTPIQLTDALTRLGEDRLRVQTAMNKQLTVLRERLTRIQNAVVLTQPQRLYDQYLQTVDQFTTRRDRAMQTQLQEADRRLRLAQAKLQASRPAERVANAQQQLAGQTRQLQLAIAARLQQAGQQLAAQAAALDHLSPLRILARGYGYVTDDTGALKPRVAAMHVGDAAQVHLQDGVLEVTVDQITQSGKAEDQ